MNKFLLAEFAIAVFLCRTSLAIDPGADRKIESDAAIFDAIESHFDRYTLYCMDTRGRTRSGMLAGEFSTDPLRCGNRSNLYLSLPFLEASLEMSRRTGCKCYTESAESHLRAFAHFGKSQIASLPLDVRANYDLTTDQFAPFDAWTQLGPEPVNWSLLFEKLPTQTRERLLAMELQIVTEPIDSFSIESAMLVFDGMCFSASEDEGRDHHDAKAACLRLARRIHKRVLESDAKSPGVHGLWMTCLTRASARLQAPEFLKMATDVLKLAAKAHSKPTVSAFTRPGHSSNRSAHPLQFPNAMLDLYEQNKNSNCLELAMRWGEALRENGLDSGSAIAEDYGRSIRFLYRLGKVSSESKFEVAAESLSRQAYHQLFDSRSKVFRSRPSENVCRDEDGIGILLQSLLLVY